MPNQTFTTLYPQAGDPELLLLAKIAAAEGRMSLTTDFPIPANGAWLPAANTLEFAVNSLAQYRIAPLGVFSWYNGAGGTRMTLNSNGLGVGVTPSAWNSGWSIIQFQNGTAVGNPLNGEGAFLSANLFRNTSNTDTYISTGFATRYRQQSGGHEFFSAPSGTGGTTAAPFLNQTMTLDVNGNLMVGVASANANGGVLQLKSGITFPATQVAATDVNTLDDYEEGTFTPTIVGGTTAGVGTYVVQNGNYTKVGNLVTFRLYVATSAHTGTGAMLISGLPFTSNGSGGQLYSASITNLGGLALTASNVAQAYINNGVNYISVAQYAAGGGAASAVPICPVPYILVSGSYMV